MLGLRQHRRKCAGLACLQRQAWVRLDQRCQALVCQALVCQALVCQSMGAQLSARRLRR